MTYSAEATAAILHTSEKDRSTDKAAALVRQAVDLAGEMSRANRMSSPHEEQKSSRRRIANRLCEPITG